jgi:uridine phosphorylase
MYKEIDHKTFREYLEKRLDINDTNRPDILIIYGGYNMPEFAKVWTQNQACQENFFYPLYLGDHHQKKIAFTLAYGDSMASEIAHIFCVLGVKAVITYGTFGALQKRIKFGQIFVPSEAMSDDGASAKYNKSGDKLLPNEYILKQLNEILLAKNLETVVGPIVSTSAMLAETQKDIDEWKEKGYFGVDLETAAVFAVCQHFKVPAVSFLTMADNLVEGQTIYDVTIDEHTLKQHTKSLMFNIALELSNKYLNGVIKND